MYGRAIGHAEWLESSWCAVAAHGPLGPVTTTTRPPAGPPTAAAAWFDFNYTQPTSALGTTKAVTPLSARGPGACGAIIAGSTRRVPWQQQRLLSNVRLGRAGLYYQPLMPPHAHGQHVDYHDIATPALCKRCGSDSEDPFHIVALCPFPAVAAAREAIIAELPDFVSRLVAAALSATAGGPPNAPLAHGAQATADLARLLAAPAGPTWSQQAGHFMLYRLLTIAPWPAACVTGSSDADALAALLGTVMDSTTAKAHRARPFNNLWHSWSAKRLQSIMFAWAYGPTRTR